MLSPRLVIAALAVPLVAGCADDAPGGPDAAVDAPVDAPIDVPDGPCGADYEMTGEYVDWYSTLSQFDGVEEAVWTVIGEPARTARSAPNGRIIICLARTATVTLSVVHDPAPGPAQYVEARFVADPAVLAGAGAIFSARGLKAAEADVRYGEILAGMTFSPNAAHVFVTKRGTPTALTLGGATSYVSDGDDDRTWVAGDTGAFTLFPNVPVGTGTAVLGGSFTGPTQIPLEAGKLTIVPIR